MHTPNLLTTFLLTTLSLAAPTPTTPKRQDLGELEGTVGTALPTILENLPNALNAIINGVDTPTTTSKQKRQADNELEDILETALPVIVANLPNALDSIINGVDTPAEKRQADDELTAILEPIVENIPDLVGSLVEEGSTLPDLSKKRQDPGELEGVLETAVPVIVANLPNDVNGIVNGD
ncbi:hypothetical protein LTR15_002060 [Elasticomyces elasticus]|nr:hypothetical protein LTR15_002060 [Elasticomyces elasticus]